MAGQQPLIYRGQGFSLRRDKNRFVLPNIFRSTVKASSEDKPILCLSKHESWNCLVGFGTSRSEEFETIIEEERRYALQAGLPYDRDARAINLYNYHHVPFDGSGRFVMPDDLTILAEVEDQLYFQGAGQYFFVFAAEALRAMTDPQFRSAQVSCAALAKAELKKAAAK